MRGLFVCFETMFVHQIDIESEEIEERSEERLREKEGIDKGEKRV